MKKKTFKWILLFLMGFSCFACNDEMSSVVEPPDIEDLNQMGKQFMKQFKESADWMGTWQFLNQE